MAENGGAQNILEKQDFPDSTFSELKPIKEEPISLDQKVCVKCELPITDKDWLDISSKSTGTTICVHEECARCQVCQVRVDSQCYLRGQLLYCKSHYHSGMYKKSHKCR